MAIDLDLGLMVTLQQLRIGFFQNSMKAKTKPFIVIFPAISGRVQSETGIDMNLELRENGGGAALHPCVTESAHFRFRVS